MAEFKQKTPEDLRPFMKTITKIVSFVFGGFVVLFGLVMLFIFFNVTKVSRQQQSWLKTEAEVIKSDIKTQHSEVDWSNNSSMRHNSRNRSRNKTSGYDDDHRTNNKTVEYTNNYIPEIFYKYEVEGNPYRGNKYRTMGYSDKNRRKIEKLVAEYPPGMKIEIYYNPANPKEAAIEKAPPPSYFVLVLGCVFIISGILFALFAGKIFMMMFDMFLNSQN